MMMSVVKDVILDDCNNSDNNTNNNKILHITLHGNYLAWYGLGTSNSNTSTSTSTSNTNNSIDVDQTNKEYEYTTTEFLRMSGLYWTTTALALLHTDHTMPKNEIVEFIKSCQDKESGGISASIGHDPHILYTLSAVQVLCIYDELDAVDIEGIVKYVSSLQNDDGSFAGDKWGEIDTRFSFCAVLCLSLLHRLDAIDVDNAVEFVKSCMNFDGGFGSKPGSESHAGLIYCCVGLLSVCGRLDVLKVDELAWWLCERQLPSGGLNGRPEKLPDLCYSWWVLASLSMLNRIHWVNKEALERFILACQDTESGGFSDRPGDIADPFHTLFGLAGLSLLGNTLVKQVNPTYCMPQDTIDRLQLHPQYLAL